MVEDISKNWFVLCTKPRNELKVKERLISIGIEVYTPVRIEVRQWSDRKKKVLVPLLPSMVLVSLQDNQLDIVFEVPGVVRYLFEHGKRAKVSNQEVLAMRSYLEGKKYYKIKNKKWILNKNWNNEANKLKNFLKKFIIKKNFT
jgi:transcription antitermination factor NusG